MEIKKINAPVAVAGSSLGLSFFFFFFLSVMNADGSLSLVLEWDLTSRVGVDLSFPLVLDFISSSFVSVVLYISACVTVFSGFYMSHESFLSRFICLLMSFVLSMVLLILFPSFLGLMVGWDGLGVTSFLLVVYYMDWDCLSAGMITALSNRVGDMFFVLGIACMSFSMSYGMVDVIYLKSLFSYTPVLILGVLIMLGSMTKSAVMPFSAWLPEAMAAPTPVSSLVHSSTLVTAGVYVLIRFGTVCGAFCSYFLMAFSLMTVVMAGMSAVSLVDAKKVVALSTLSQVSLMMLAISVGAVGVAFFHLLVHAFFKALMFLCLGSVIFYSGGVQDVRFLGSLLLKMPLVFILLLISNLSLVGFPFLSGYYSKELIVGSCLVGHSSAFMFFLVYLVLVLTFAYSGRMIWLLCTFQDVGAVSSYKSESIHLNTSLLLMSFGAVFSGLVGQSFMIKMNFFSPVFSLSFWGGLLLVGLWVLNMLVMFWF
uniref:NADH-ubiquinone oxidoreductase chain 5 n=1 Tax=Saxidomus purpurata TaxID=311201 RepID=A0A0D4CFR9_9BIVA|nr:NADH dehydrogenase subunit 5 [Saxidomus purpurata]AJT47993.1 NADH dehydrogenase subunit 5 [Saxidomus purpurata]